MAWFRRTLSWLLVGASLGLLLVTVACFTWQPERLAAFTVMPIWVWGGLGLLLSSTAFICLRARFSLPITAIWIVTLLVGADEARVLGHLGQTAPLPGPALPHDGKAVLRVITLNCDSFSFGDPATDLAAWQPDIVLIQEAYPHQVQRLATVLFNGRGEFRCHQSNAIITRWHIDRETSTTTNRDQQATLVLPNGSQLEVVNIHLASAATDLRLWERAAWREHYTNRTMRRQELSTVLQNLAKHATLPATPIIFGGDFNSPTSDPVHGLLATEFTDAFSAVGTGWGDTFQRRVPILRIDHLYANSRLTPIRCRAVTTRHSDHRMVVADFLTIQFPNTVSRTNCGGSP